VDNRCLILIGLATLAPRIIRTNDITFQQKVIFIGCNTNNIDKTKDNFASNLRTRKINSLGPFLTTF